jgi:zinc finger protein
VTTVEGVLRRTIAGLEQDQPVRRALEPEDAARIDSYIKRIEDLLNLNQPFHMVSFLLGSQKILFRNLQSPV